MKIMIINIIFISILALADCRRSPKWSSTAATTNDTTDSNNNNYY